MLFGVFCLLLEEIKGFHGACNGFMEQGMELPESEWSKSGMNLLE
jgi:hypothetical protein